MNFKHSWYFYCDVAPKNKNKHQISVGFVHCYQFPHPLPTFILFQLFSLQRNYYLLRSVAATPQRYIQIFHSFAVSIFRLFYFCNSLFILLVHKTLEYIHDALAHYQNVNRDIGKQKIETRKKSNEKYRKKYSLQLRLLFSLYCNI